MNFDSWLDACWQHADIPTFETALMTINIFAEDTKTTTEKLILVMQFEKYKWNYLNFANIQLISCQMA